MSPEKRALLKFNRQRSNAKCRGIRWELTFEQWWNIWQESGHYNQRDATRYVMARNWDAGPYAVGNVEIQTASQNALTYWARRRAGRVKHNWHAAAKPISSDVLDILIAEEEERDQGIAC